MTNTMTLHHGGLLARLCQFVSVLTSSTQRIRVFPFHPPDINAITRANSEGAMLAESIKNLWRSARQGVRAIAVPTLLLALTGGFAWQSTQGDHGLIMRSRREQQLRQAEANLDTAKAERATWERKVAGLTASHLDKDALDQRVRELLNLADPKEIVIQYGPKDKLF